MAPGSKLLHITNDLSPYVKMFLGPQTIPQSVTRLPTESEDMKFIHSFIRITLEIFSGFLITTAQVAYIIFHILILPSAFQMYGFHVIITTGT